MLNHCFFWKQNKVVFWASFGASVNIGLNTDRWAVVIPKGEGAQNETFQGREDLHTTHHRAQWPCQRAPPSQGKPLKPAVSSLLAHGTRVDPGVWLLMMPSLAALMFTFGFVTAHLPFCEGTEWVAWRPKKGHKSAGVVPCPLSLLWQS